MGWVVQGGVDWRRIVIICNSSNLRGSEILAAPEIQNRKGGRGKEFLNSRLQ